MSYSVKYNEAKKFVESYESINQNRKILRKYTDVN